MKIRQIRRLLRSKVSLWLLLIAAVTIYLIVWRHQLEQLDSPTEVRLDRTLHLSPSHISLALHAQSKDVGQLSSSQLPLQTDEGLLPVFLPDPNITDKQTLSAISHTSSMTCNYCFPYRYKYIITEPNICQEFGVPPVVLIMITSRVTGGASRQLIRDTWLQSAAHYPGRIAYAFTLGSSDNKTVMTEVRRESEKYHDIVQGAFLDMYRNLTLKTVMMLQWTSSFCGHARYLLKTDEDMFINIPQLLYFLFASNINFQRTLVGACLRKPSKPYRNPRHKYFVSRKEYPSHWYPPFCSGTAYVMSMDTAKKLYSFSPNMRFVPLEDIYLGLILKELKYDVKDHPMFHLKRVNSRPIEFYCHCVISAHGILESKKLDIWRNYYSHACHNFIGSHRSQAAVCDNSRPEEILKESYRVGRWIVYKVKVKRPR